MKVTVLGAGVIGVSTAYFLRRAGHEVTVVDRQDAAGLETSYANGGQISASHAAPWASPAAPALMLKWLGKKDAPLLWHLRADPAQWAWGLRFLMNCRASRFRQNTERTLVLALYSRSLLRELRDETGLEYDQKTEGILQIFRDPKKYDAAARHAEELTALGCETRAVGKSECLEIEPALSDTGADIVGGVYAPGDETGDALRFTQELARITADQGVEFKYGVSVERLEVDSERVTRLVTSAGDEPADAYIVALGSYSQLLLKPLGIDPHIFPAKGYSITAPVDGYNGAPSVSITDVDKRVVFTRLGNRLRAAGTAEFAGYDTRLNDSRARVILDHARAQFPNGADYANAQLWTGLRPLTPDGLPVVSRTPYANLFLNTGHGTLGWTLAAGSGKAATDLATSALPQIEHAYYSLKRF